MKYEPDIVDEAFLILRDLVVVLDAIEEVSENLPDDDDALRAAVEVYQDLAQSQGMVDEPAQAYTTVALDAVLALRAAMHTHLHGAVVEAEYTIKE